MNLSDLDLTKLDTSNVGAWPTPAKVLVAVIVFAVALVAGYFLLVKDQMETLDNAKRQEQQLRRTFEQRAERAANLEPYKAQLAEMQTILCQLIRQLPSRTEMPDLLVDISQAALAAGIENELFEPGTEVIRDFYAEKPISLRMVGTYHQFGKFVSDVASLPRVVILTMHDISLRPQQADQAAAAGTLVLEGTVRTYRYVDDEQDCPQPGVPQTAALGSGR